MEDGSINQHPFDVLSETNIPLEVGSEWLYDGGDIVDYLRFETNLLDRVSFHYIPNIEITPLFYTTFLLKLSVPKCTKGLPITVSTKHSLQ